MMKKIQLGKTNLHVSRIGLGTVKFGRNQGVHYPAEFDLPSDQAILELLSCAKELGINLLDTAPAYGNSEERLGKLLGTARHEWIISTKAGEEFDGQVSHFDFTPAGIRKSVERSLKRLKTDYLDIVLIHSNGEDKKIIEEYNVFSTLEFLKKEGHIRAYGMSTKTVEGGFLTIDQADLAMVTYNLLHTEEKSVIEHAYQKSKGIFIKKALISGHLQKVNAKDPVKKALDFVLQEPGVTSVILGTLNIEHWRHASLRA